jgi:hypothetical protein
MSLAISELYFIFQTSHHFANCLSLFTSIFSSRHSFAVQRVASARLCTSSCNINMNYSMFCDEWKYQQALQRIRRNNPEQPSTSIRESKVQTFES